GRARGGRDGAGGGGGGPHARARAGHRPAAAPVADAGAHRAAGAAPGRAHRRGPGRDGPRAERAMSAVRVAVVQATPVVLDAEASVEKACGLIVEAGAGGARIVALPETFVPLYPSSAWAHGCARFGRAPAELHRRLWANSVDVPGPLTDRLGQAAREAGAWVGIGVNERDARPPGALWDPLGWVAPGGTLAGRHRQPIPPPHRRALR